MDRPRSRHLRATLIAAAAIAATVVLTAVLSRLTGGREFTDDLGAIHYLADHPFVLIGFDAHLLEGLPNGFRAYPPLQPLLIALALAPFRFLPDFWSQRIATALVLLACLYQGRMVLADPSGRRTATRRLLLAALFFQFLCAGAVWAQLDDAISALAVLTMARLRPKTPATAIIAAGVMLFFSKIMLLPAAAALIITELRSAAGWKRPSVAIASAGFVAVFAANRLTLGLLGKDALLSYGSHDPMMGVGLTSLLWSLGLHAEVMLRPFVPFALAILIAVALAIWKCARGPAQQGNPGRVVIDAAPIAGRLALVLSQLLMGLSQPEYLLWIMAGWLLLSSRPPGALVFRQITMLSIAGAAAWGTNICYGLFNAAEGPKRRLLDLALRFTNESWLHVAWYLCVLTTTALLALTLVSDLTAQKEEASLR